MVDDLRYAFHAAMIHNVSPRSIPNVARARLWATDMDEPKDRIRKARIEKGFETAADAARAFGWTESTVRHHENGTRRANWQWAQKYARAYGVTPEYIMAGKGKPSEDVTLGVEQTPVTVNVYGEVAAGLWFEDDGWHTPRYDRIPVVPMRYKSVEQSAWKVIGPSMDLRGIVDGGYIITVPYWEVRRGIQDADLVVVERRDGSKIERTVKEVLVYPDRTEFWPRSTAPEFQQPIVIPRDRDHDSQVEVIGLVVGFYKPF